MQNFMNPKVSPLHHLLLGGMLGAMALSTPTLQAAELGAPGSFALGISGGLVGWTDDAAVEGLSDSSRIALTGKFYRKEGRPVHMQLGLIQSEGTKALTAGANFQLEKTLTRDEEISTTAHIGLGLGMGLGLEGELFSAWGVTGNAGAAIQLRKSGVELGFNLGLLVPVIVADLDAPTISLSEGLMAYVSPNLMLRKYF